MPKSKLRKLPEDRFGARLRLISIQVDRAMDDYDTGKITITQARRVVEQAVEESENLAIGIIHHARLLRDVLERHFPS